MGYEDMPRSPLFTTPSTGVLVVVFLVSCFLYWVAP